MKKEPEARRHSDFALGTEQAAFLTKKFFACERR